MSDQMQIGGPTHEHQTAARGSQISARAWATLAALALLWGIPYLLIKVVVDDGVPPVFLAWARIVLGAARCCWVWLGGRML